MISTFYLSGRICGSKAIREIAEKTDKPYTMICLKPDIEWVYLGQDRMIQVLEMSGGTMVYADHFAKVANHEGEWHVTEAPVIDYQRGSLRDDFDFGSVMLWRTDALKAIAAEMDTEYEYAGLYDLRLRAGSDAIIHIPEYLYYEVETDTRKSGEKLFDYVDPRNRAVQIEMERSVTAHLKRIGAYLESGVYSPLPKGETGGVTASVIIPCKNRARTIADAIRSALNQKVKDCYSFNVIVVDDNSTDGTAEIISNFQSEIADGRLIYIAQDKSWHAIGGNWNVAIHDPRCGRYAIQLDSDDTYPNEDTVQKFIDVFESGEYGMVIGTYQLTNMAGEVLPPGVIDHREWTESNGRNNALRINGLGAPRGFYVPLLRSINYPTTKYGEDYSVGLRISREWRIGRIYDVIYNCRRWEDNSDANCDIVSMNRNNLYKDRLRTWELIARMHMSR